MNRHYKCHNGEKLYDCTTCQKTFYQKSALNRHMYVHNDDKSFKCRICEKSYKLRDKERHEKEHFYEFRHKCDTCDKAFNNLSSLKTHNLIHTDEKPYKCKTCGKVFRQSAHLKIHLDSVHKVEKLYNCSYCTYSCKQNSNLKNHNLKQYTSTIILYVNIVFEEANVKHHNVISQYCGNLRSYSQTP